MRIEELIWPALSRTRRPLIGCRPTNRPRGRAATRHRRPAAASGAAPHGRNSDRIRALIGRRSRRPWTLAPAGQRRPLIGYHSAGSPKGTERVLERVPKPKRSTSTLFFYYFVIGSLFSFFRKRSRQVFFSTKYRMSLNINLKSQIDPTDRNSSHPIECVAMDRQERIAIKVNFINSTRTDSWSCGSDTARACGGQCEKESRLCNEINSLHKK